MPNKIRKPSVVTTHHANVPDSRTKNERFGADPRAVALPAIASNSSQAAGILGLQRRYGNRQVQQLLRQHSPIATVQRAVRTDGIEKAASKTSETARDLEALHVDGKAKTGILAAQIAEIQKEVSKVRAETGDLGPLQPTTTADETNDNASRQQLRQRQTMLNLAPGRAHYTEVGQVQYKYKPKIEKDGLA